MNTASPYAVRRPVENEYLVRERDRRSRRVLALVLAVVSVLGVGLLVYTWIHIEITHVGYRVDGLEKELGRAFEEERRLRLEEAALTHPRLLEERAAAELGMRPPRLNQTLFYQELKQ